MGVEKFDQGFTFNLLPAGKGMNTEQGLNGRRQRQHLI
jgi:hypothetical protein